MLKTALAKTSTSKIFWELSPHSNTGHRQSPSLDLPLHSYTVTLHFSKRIAAPA